MVKGRRLGANADSALLLKGFYAFVVLGVEQKKNGRNHSPMSKDYISGLMFRIQPQAILTTALSLDGTPVDIFWSSSKGDAMLIFVSTNVFICKCRGICLNMNYFYT